MHVNTDFSKEVKGHVTAMVAHVTPAFTGVQGQPELHSKFKASLGCMRPWSRNKIRKGGGGREEGRKRGNGKLFY